MTSSDARLGKNAILALAATVFIQSLSFLSIKISTTQTGILAAGFLILAFGLMGLRALLWQKLLHLADLSLVYPFTSLVQVLVLLYAVMLFNESIAVGHFIGLILMLTGAFIMSGER